MRALLNVLSARRLHYSSTRTDSVRVLQLERKTSSSIGKKLR